MKTREFSASMTSDGHLFKIIEGVSASVALDVASNLSEGVGLILERLYDAVNDGDSIYTGELQALKVMAELSSALTASVSDGVRQKEEGAPSV